MWSFFSRRGQQRNAAPAPDRAAKPRPKEPPRRSWTWLAWGAVSLAWLVAGTGLALLVSGDFLGGEAAAQNAPAPPAKPKPSAPQAPARRNEAAPAAAGQAAPALAASNDDPFNKHARDAGVKRCLSTYAELGKALTDGSTFTVQTQTTRDDADRHALQGLAGLTYRAERGPSGTAAGLVFAAPTPAGCEGTMVRIVPLPQNCQAAAALVPAGGTAQPPVANIPLVKLPGGAQVMLVPAGENCVAITVLRGGQQ